MCRRSFLFPSLGVAAVLLLSHCSSPTQPDYSALSRELTPEELQLVASSDRFGFKLFREVVRQDADKNIFISPLSVSMALGMTANGAADSTLAAMRATLELDVMTEEESNAAYQSLIELLSGADPKVQFSIANSIWYRQGLAVIDDFLDRCRDFFNAVVRGLDFGAPTAADVINAWVEENTEGKIEAIVDKPIDPMTVMFLINALYFKGDWTYQFDPQDTRAQEFTLLGGSTVSVSMMNQPGDHFYQAWELFQAVDLPYGDGLFRMTVLLPSWGIHVDSLIAQLTPENWQLWIGSFETADIRLGLPKFTLEYELELKAVLQALGISAAFDRVSADFTRIVSREDLQGQNLYITKVKHKTFVKVNEEGTEAAAVTSVEVGITSDPPAMIVNRPFLFVIRERTSGALLFMGKIVEPVWEEG